MLTSAAGLYETDPMFMIVPAWPFSSRSWHSTCWATGCVTHSIPQQVTRGNSQFVRRNQSIEGLSSGEDQECDSSSCRCAGAGAGGGLRAAAPDSGGGGGSTGGTSAKAMRRSPSS